MRGAIMMAFYFPAFLLFLVSNRTPKLLYKLHRKLFVETNGKLNDFMSDRYKKSIGKYEMKSSSGVLGDLKSEDVGHIMDSLNENGYHVFENKLSDDIIDKITQYATEEPARILDFKKFVGFTKEKYLFDTDNVLSPKYSYTNDQLVNEESVQEIIFDANLLHIAQEYLGVQPILDSVDLWWSAPFDGQGTSAAAQEYHFDMDRLKFIKFFFYLSDVGPENGPHCYVPKSHKNLPAELRKDGRKTDDVVKKYYNPLEICGKKGTILAVDTRGLHKGKPLTDKHRLLLQVEFANSLFGKSYEYFPLKKKVYENQMESFERTYSLFKVN